MININQIIAYGLYLGGMAVVGYVTNVWKSHSQKVLELKEREEQRAAEIFGQQTVDKAKQIVKDTVYQVEQLAKSQDWEGIVKKTKVIDIVQDKLKKLGGGKTILSQADIVDIIESTVGYINSKKVEVLQK